MAGGFFRLDNARDLLDKLVRDHDKLVTEPTADTVFNFFVTGWSIRDWILSERPDLRGQVNDLYDGELQYCQDIGNKAKHFTLIRHRTYARPSDPDTVISSWGALNETPINAHAINGGEIRWSLSYGGIVAISNVFEYAKYVVDALVAFFDRYEISPHPVHSERNTS